MKLETYKFPELSINQEIPAALLKEAKARDTTKGVEKFNQLFYSGGEVQLQKDITGTWKETAWLFCKSLMRSWAPKHEDKEIVCGMIMEEVLILDKGSSVLGIVKKALGRKG